MDEHCYITIKRRSTELETQITKVRDQLKLFELEREIYSIVLVSYKEPIILPDYSEVSEKIKKDARFKIINRGKLFLTATSKIDSTNKRIGDWKYTFDNGSIVVVIHKERKNNINLSESCKTSKESYTLDQLPYKVFLTESIKNELIKKFDSEKKYFVPDENIARVGILVPILILQALKERIEDSFDRYPQLISSVSSSRSDAYLTDVQSLSPLSSPRDQSCLTVRKRTSSFSKDKPLSLILKINKKQ